MATFMVERSLKGISMEDLGAAQKAAIASCAQSSADGSPVRYLRSTFVPESGACMCLFEAPDAEQGSGYGMPALVYRGKPLVSVMRAKKHIGVYPFSPEAVAAVSGALEGHPGVGLDKGTIRYQPEHPLPDDVVRALVVTRREQIER